MAWSLYTGTVYGSAGALVAFLDTNLVAAGWSIQASTGNIRRYIPGAGAATYGNFAFVVDDSSGSEALGYGVRDGVGYSGSTLLPNVGTDLNLHYCTRSSTASNNLRLHKGGVVSPTVPIPEVRLYADDRTFILATAKTTSSINWSVFYVGEFYSYTPSDSFKACVWGPASTPQQLQRSGYLVRGPSVAAYSGQSGGVLCPQHGYGGGCANAAGSTGNACNFALGTSLKRTDTSLANSNTTFGGSTMMNYIGGPFRFPNPVDNGMVVSPVHIVQSSEAGGRRGVRGRLRGWYVPEHGHQYWSPADLDTFNGSGDLASKSFILYKSLTDSAGTTLSTFTAVETSTPETSS